jgi:multisubunit Na+/H+ antiporter MnhB subunit
MVAGLLYVIGLITVLITIAVAGFNIPNTIADVTRQLDTGGTGAQNLLSIAQMVAATYGRFATTFLAGLLLMGAGRVIMLLGAINRSLRGQS